MKCKRCGTEMKRQKAGYGYKYVCPKCGLVISGKHTDTQTDNGGSVETHNSDD